ncbi:thiolase family protein [Planomonospora parontospora]|uniref:thiolase family protein n=1 Tax=Planomonospora parontospora TaxID=58119 RepID=UPI0016712F8A|nr:thiolase family protein [Planomonospora parontospora]GGL43294.1 acetyl-CoA acetyltransferase [Planomonospora parontospora subsp. antibiotica]GII18499.1 acetyl-CoA acetyltransferase [Planomonospora parontospora subsp. antibiotica]
MSTGTRAVYVLDAVRTPFGRYGGALAGVRPDDLAAHVLKALMERTGQETVDEVVLGNANGAGEENRNVARMAALLAGLPVTTPGVTVNRLCGSGMEAVVQAYRMIALGEACAVVAGGVESMTRAPWVLPKPDRTFPPGGQELVSTTLGWRLVNPRMPAEHTIALGEGAELIADKHGITRTEQDAFALASHRKAARASFEREITPVGGLTRDEGIRPDTSPEKLAGLKPVFRPGGTVTAGNSSPLSDGAAALLLVSGDGLRGREPLARITASAVSALEPRHFGLGPVEATRRALERAGRGFADLTTAELNEAFAAQTLGCLAELPELDPSIVNPQGGAIALGHPLGASGARITGTVAHRLAAAGSGTGLASLCIGVGQGLAVILER